MDMTFKLAVFEGPLDLLLHLIDMNKIDIYDIPIALITDQYMAYIREMELLDMDVTSDFLVMAATLLRIKSQMLLPVEAEATAESGEDPRMELVSRLLEYKTYKYMAQALKERADAARLSFYKPMTIPKDMVYTAPPIDLDALVGDTNIADLRAIFESVMKRQQDKIDPVRSQYGRIDQEPEKKADRIVYIRNDLEKNKDGISFRKLLEAQPTTDEIVVTFLAVLELMKDGSAVIVQNALFDEIYITGVEK